MKKIEINQFYNFHFLSKLNITPCKSKLFFTDTVCDVDNNDYKQRLMRLDLKSNELTEMVPFQKRVQSFLIGCGNLIVLDEDKEDKTTHTVIKQMHPKTREIRNTFKLPLAVDNMVEYDENTYLVQATIDTNAADYYLWNEDKKKAYHEHKKENADYLEFDEYPFIYNGAGVINGNRSALFLVDKNTYKCERITTATMNVETFDYREGEIIYTGIDYKKAMGKLGKVYSYDVHTKETKVLAEGLMVFRAFYYKGNVEVIGTYGKDFGAMEAGKFYEIRDGKLELVYDTELSLMNSMASDIHYGSGKGFYRENDDVYFTSADGTHVKLFKYEDYKLVCICDLDGSVDDYVIGRDAIYVIATKDQDLQDIYKADKEITKLTHLNDLSEYYVAKPEHMVLNKRTPIDGWVMLPENYDASKKYPGILDIHGGPKSIYTSTYYHEMQYWVNLGYIVFYCNPRGGDGKGNEFADLRHNWGCIDYDDIMDFVDAVIKKYPGLDENRLGVTGGSYGGYMTNWIIGQTDRFQCAVSQRSISNWISEVCASDMGIDFPIEQCYTDIMHCEAEMWIMSPLKYSVNCVTPTLFIQSTEDYRCPFDQALQYYTVLKNRGIESKLVGFKGECHDLSRTGKPVHRIKRLTEITNWMNKHLM